MKTTVVIFIVQILCSSINAQSESLFEKYIASLEITGQKLTYDSFVKYDTTDRVKNLSSWMGFCLKNFKIDQYLIEKEIDDIHFLVQLDTNGTIYNISTNEKKIESYLKKKLIGRNFYKEHISKIQINGICISRVDLDFYKQYFSAGADIPVYWSSSGGSNCNC